MKVNRFIIVLGVWFAGCTSHDTISIDPASYFPLRKGVFQEYSVTNTTYNQSSCSAQPLTSTTTYYLRCEVSDSVKNSEGQYTYLIKRYTRSATTDPWTDLDTWSARWSNNQLIVAEENTSYVKFVTPLRDSATWNGNLYNSLGNETYKLINHNVSYTFPNDVQFNNTLLVRQSNTNNLVNQNQRYERYASGVGLVVRESTVITFLTDDCFGQRVPQSGSHYVQTLITYGSQ